MGTDARDATTHAVAERKANRHTLVGIILNVLLLGLIAYGFWRSEEWKWAWALVAIPILLVTLHYARHWLAR